MHASAMRKFAGLRPAQVAIGDQLSTAHTDFMVAEFSTFLLQTLQAKESDSLGRKVVACLDKRDADGVRRLLGDFLYLGTPRDTWVFNQVRALYSRRTDHGSDDDRKVAALSAFNTAEERCKETNRLFLARRQGRLMFRPVVEDILNSAKRKIADLLGEVPSLKELRPRFGPGGSTLTPKRISCLPIKMAESPACSTNLSGSQLLPALLAENNYGSRGWGDCLVGPLGIEPMEISITPARLAFVEKNYKTFRAIVTEPSLNGMWQIALGDWLASRLKRWGLSIDNQFPNQELARMGSIYGNVATVDLTSASDLVAVGLVQELLPEDWFSLLMDLRSADVEMPDGTLRHLEKISSMGNGFTFPLETMIFYAIALEVEKRFSSHCLPLTRAYGDDIIVATTSAVPLLEVLSDLGFLANPAKTHHTGHFRESCGADYVLGYNVRPVFLEASLRGDDLFRLHNHFFRRGEFSMAKWWRQYVHPASRLHGPDGFGDGHLLGCWIPTKVVKQQSGTWFFRSWQRSPLTLYTPGGSRSAEVKRFISRQGSFLPRWDRLCGHVAGYLSYRKEGTEHWSDMFFPREKSDIWTIPGEGAWATVRIHVFEFPTLAES